VRSTPVIALAALLACLPARAVELIDLHDLHAVHDGGGRAAIARAPVPAYMPASLAGYRIDQRIIDLSGEDPAGMRAEILPDMPRPADSWPAAGIPAAAPAPMPVPEPVSVLMLACGLLLIMPGAWAARWSRLGDNKSLLQRRLP
jgi:hypothetical protein